MELRQELRPPDLDEALVARLAELAKKLDGARDSECQRSLNEFNRLACTELPFEDFQGIYGAGEHECWVRRVLWNRAIRPAPDVTREELIEVVRRAMPSNNPVDYEAYMAIFDANVAMPGASNLIFYPANYNHRRDWQSSYDPTPGEIVDQALAVKPTVAPPPGQRTG